MGHKNTKNFRPLTSFARLNATAGPSLALLASACAAHADEDDVPGSPEEPETRGCKGSPEKQPEVFLVATGFPERMAPTLHQLVWVHRPLCRSIEKTSEVTYCLGGDLALCIWCMLIRDVWLCPVLACVLLSVSKVYNSVVSLERLLSRDGAFFGVMQLC